MLSTVLPILNKIINVNIFSFVSLLDWLSKKYPSEVLESLSPEVLSERLKKFYQELTEHYSASAHLSISASGYGIEEDHSTA